MVRYQAALSVAIEVAREAGEILREEFHRPGGPEGTAHHAEADDRAEAHIRKRLLAAEPWSYLGEESGAESRDSDHLWLVDPNDGTAAYMKGRRGSSVSIAVLRDGVPVLGVVYAFGYPDDDGDLIAWAEGCGPVTRNGQPDQFRFDDAKLDNNSIVLVSHDAVHNPAANARCVLPGRFRSIPSIAYRLALAAVGEGVAAVSLHSPCSWDYGAAHALLRGAGGVFVDEKGNPISYTRDGKSHARDCFGGGPSAVKELSTRSWSKVFDRSHEDDGSVFGLVKPVPGRTIRDAALLARAQGCLLGQLIGDALGSQVEFQSAKSIQSRHPEGVRQLEGGGHFNTIAGQPTDDSEMALMLARCLVREGKYDAGAVLKAYIHWFESGPFDIGNTTSAALGAARSLLQQSQANGSLMRISPLAIFGWSRPDEAVEWVRRDSGLTHPNPVCRESCAAFVRAIITALNGGDAQACYKAALEEAQRGGEAAVIAALENAVAKPPQGMDGPQWGWVLIALQNAFYRLLQLGSFEDALVDTVACGGDTDTNAAICGALLGAIHGRDGIPSRWRQSVLTCRPLIEAGAHQPRPQDFWPVDALELAESLLLACPVRRPGPAQ
jgi:ADP-ribosyl-[dinitrogen reductase] hydrolase